MYVSVRQLDAHLWNVIDLDTGKPIGGVQWANDETGEYQIVLFNDDGSVKYDQERKDVVRVVKKGNIKLVGKEEEK